jgi:GWxTD domain-containing protein
MKLKCIINFISLSLFLLPAHFSLFAQTLAPSETFLINFDYSRFRNNATTGYLELYYSFYCGHVTFYPEGENLKGGVTLNTDLVNASTGQSVIKERVVVPVVVEDTTITGWKTMPIVRLAGHVVPFGDYRLHVVAYDSANSTRRDSLSLPLEMKAYAARPAISDMELCTLIQASTNSRHPYFKNAHEVTPNPSLVFGALTPVIYVYSELYDVDTSKVYTLDYEILSEDGSSAKKVSRQRRYRKSNPVEVGTLNAVALQPGKYALRLALRDSPQAQPAQIQKEFFVYQTRTASTELATTPGALALAIEALAEKEVEDEFQKAKYLADKAEISFFSQLKTVPAKKEFLKEFWSRREAGSANETPYRRIDYLRRLQIADERYSQYTKKGWRTDRGRAFILYGKPDEVERHPSEGVTKPYEVWYYYQIENGVQFVFVDKNGFGDYELVHSSKRGEFSDDTWQRYLQ